MSRQGANGISWTDETWNPIRGCSRVSEGCRHCYAERVARRFNGPGQPYHGIATASGWTREVRVIEEHIADPLRWTRPRMVFVNSMSDLFHEKLPTDAIDRIFAVMALASRHTFQVVTKRARRMRGYLDGLYTPDGFRRLEAHARDLGHSFRFEDISLLPRPIPNVWGIVSIEDQETADERVPDVCRAELAVRGVSLEPMLGPVDLAALRGSTMTALDGIDFEDLGWGPGGTPSHPFHALDWVIVGGESGPFARPMDPAWVRDVRDACIAARVAFHFKQWGAWAPCGPVVEDSRFHGGRAFDMWTGGRAAFVSISDNRRKNYRVLAGEQVMQHVGKRLAGHTLDGVEWREFPRRVAA